MSETPRTVLVLMGGPDAERQVSLMSGRAVAEALRGTGRLKVVERIIDAPSSDELRALVDRCGAEVIFPVLHGHWGEGGPLQALLEEAGRPYVGSRPGPAARAMDKLVTKTLLGDEVRTPRARELAADEPCDIEPPLVLKPVDDGSSVDLRICRTPDDVERGRAELHVRRPRLMAESYITGREVTVGILHGEALPLVEITPGEGVAFYDYDAKYFRDDTSYVVDPVIDAGVADECARAALMAYGRLGCRDLARVDFIVDDRGPWFLEINTMPGFTTHSLVPMAAAATGRDMRAVCESLVEAALRREDVRCSGFGIRDSGSEGES